MEIVEYLMSLCDADLEQRGLYEVQDDRWVKYEGIQSNLGYKKGYPALEQIGFLSYPRF